MGGSEALSQDGTLPRDGAFRGRKHGHKLRAYQAGLMDGLLGRLRLDPRPEALADLPALFPVPVDEVRLEVGFGAGEHLLTRAREAPRTGFLGVEPYVNGMAKLLAAVAAEGLPNLRLHDDDAAVLLDALPEASLARVDLLYPDPWPKRRQRKRRFVSPARLAAIARVLRPGGEFRFATDIDDYAGWTLARAARVPGLAWTAERADDWRRPWPGWVRTRYEAKAVAAGRRPSYLTFARL